MAWDNLSEVNGPVAMMQRQSVGMSLISSWRILMFGWLFQRAGNESGELVTINGQR